MVAIYDFRVHGPLWLPAGPTVNATSGKARRATRGRRKEVPAPTACELESLFAEDHRHMAFSKNQGPLMWSQMLGRPTCKPKRHGCYTRTLVTLAKAIKIPLTWNRMPILNRAFFKLLLYEDLILGPRILSLIEAYVQSNMALLSLI